MQHSDTIGAIALALAKAQGAIKGALKDSTNPHFKSSYADLASVWAACRDPLSANELSVVQTPGECAAGQVALTTLLMHSSGEWISDTLTIPLTKVDAQGYGSATTYARRYALASFVGVAPDDDDGQAAVNARGAANDAPANLHKTPVTADAHPPVNANRPAPLEGFHKTRKAVKEACDRITQELRGAADKDALDAFIATEQATIDQIHRIDYAKLPVYWDGLGDEYPGMAEEIRRAYVRLEDYGEQGDEGEVLVDMLRAG